MISHPLVSKTAIRNHYDLATFFYRLFWGPHIHHGLWTADESPRVAQQQLIDALAFSAHVTSGDRVLDVGCGMGGSSIHLAKRFGCCVTGITLSGVQQRWASRASRWQGCADSIKILCEDVESITLAPSSYDVIWSIECTEHLFDKAAFFRNAASWVRPGGHVAICAWLAAHDADIPEKRSRVEAICEGFLCPSLGSFEDYRSWLHDAGLRVEVEYDWTEHVERTWEICAARTDRPWIKWLATKLDPAQRLFLDRFPSLLAAYRTGAMRYGCIVARRPLHKSDSIYH